MAIRISKIPNLKWIYISPITEADIGYLEKNFRFHSLDLKDCLEGVQRAKMDIYKYYLFMIFHFPTFDYRRQRIGIRTVNIFLGKNYIITLAREKDKYLQGYFLRIKKNKRSQGRLDSIRNTAGYKLYKIVDIEYRKSLSVVNEIGRYLSKVENEVFSGKNKEATEGLSVVRRNIFNLRSIIGPQLKMIDRLVGMKNNIIPDEMSVYFDDVHDYLENIWSALDNYRDIADSLYDTNESFINQRTNEVIKLLTVISVALLPATLLASIYGMNVIDLPLAQRKLGLWAILGIMALMVGGSIYFAKKKKII